MMIAATILTVAFLATTIGLFVFMLWNNWHEKRIAKVISWYSMFCVVIYILFHGYSINQAILLPDFIMAATYGADTRRRSGMANPVQKQYERNFADNPLRMLPDRLRSNCFWGRRPMFSVSCSSYTGSEGFLFSFHRIFFQAFPSIYFFEPLFGQLIQAE